MQIRGLYGFYKNGVTKATYNNDKSHLEWLGEDVVQFIRTTSLEEMNEMFDRIELVDQEDEVLPHHLIECAQWTRTAMEVDGQVLQIAEGTPFSWYNLLRASQGDLNAYKEGLRYMLDVQDFIKDSLFCMFAYIINLDTNMLEIYNGLRKTRDQNPRNRYRNRIKAFPREHKTKYAPCHLIYEFPLQNIPSDWIEQIKRSYPLTHSNTPPA